MNEKKAGFSLSGAGLKWIAMASMLLDHIGAVLVPGNTAAYYALRIIGRLAFPLFCFLLVEGFYHTSNVYRYGAGLVLFAFLSEVPFDLALFGRLWAPEYQNVFFTLALGIFGVLYYDKLTKEGHVLFGIAAEILAVFMAFFLSCDYGAEGVLLIFLFYLFHFKETYRNLAAAIWCVALGAVETFGALSLLFINVYNGKRGKIRYKYLFYLFYPAHLLVLGLIKYFLF